jgi:uncharacterized membrane protein YdjX (TVP38/TMEM64 family)
MDTDEIVVHEEVDRQRTPNFARQGILTVTLVRLGPAAPFSMLNLAAATGISARPQTPP